jgi:hypothetical protein
VIETIGKYNVKAAYCLLDSAQGQGIEDLTIVTEEEQKY